MRASLFFLFSSRVSAILLASLLVLLPVQASAADSPPMAEQSFLATYRKLQPLLPSASFQGAEIQTFYSLRGYKPVWRTEAGEIKATVPAFVESLEAVIDTQGLDRRDYPLEQVKAVLAKQENATPDEAALTEFLLTDWLIRLAHDLNGDRGNLSQLYVGWNFTKPKRDIVADLVRVIDQNGLSAYLNSLCPVDPDYWALVAVLKAYREIEQKSGWSIVPTGPSIKPEMRDARVPLVLDRLAAEGYRLETDATLAEPAFYSKEIAALVSQYQSRNTLEADGAIGAKTIVAMNVSVARRIRQILANMERLRHMPRLYPARYAMVNIASETLKLIDNGQVVYQVPVVVGRPDRKTPFIESTIRSVIFNPSWHVPASIAKKDILPKLRKDPHYLEKLGFVINGSAEDDPHGKAVDWSTISASAFAFRLRQAPGDMNSLGRIKFDFDNDFSVYMHGTPHDELFARAERHLSSGCIRLKDPEQFATYVLAHNDGKWELADVQTEIDKDKTRWLKVAEPLPLYVIYQTAYFPTPDSPVSFAPDVYNYDAILMNALEDKERL
ncbi:MAG: L,D-transpeptidase family protein [Alphaproteobacteria bacterium]|nr:L,D-transpeptidase family protein [Alphaproteobacteria bacterium]